MTRRNAGDHARWRGTLPHRWWVWGTVGFGALLLAFWLWSRDAADNRPEDTHRRSSSPVITAGVAAADAVGDVPAAGDIAAWLEELRDVVARKPQEAVPLLRDFLARVEGSHGAESLAAASVLDLLVESLWKSGAAADAETSALAARALGIKRLRCEDGDPRIAESLRNQGILAELNERLPEARDLFTQTRALVERAQGAADPGVARLTNDLAIVATKMGRYAEAIAEYEAALAIFEQADPPDELEIAGVLNGLASAHSEVGDYVESRRIHERALQLRRRHLPPDHPKVAETLNNLGALLTSMGDDERARQLFEQVLAVRRQAYGEEHPLTAAARVNLARVLLNQERHAEARVLYEAAREVFEQKQAHSSLIPCLLGLGTLHRQTGQWEAARQQFTRALAMQRETLGPTHPYVGETLHKLAALRFETGDLDEAQRLCHEAIALQQQSLGMEHPGVTQSQVLLAEVLAARGAEAEAFRLAARAETASRENVEIAFRSMAQREALLFARMRSRGLDLMQRLSVDAGEPEQAAITWGAVIAARALVLDEMVQRRRAAAHATDPELSHLVAEYQAAGERFANLAFRTFEGGAAARDERLQQAGRSKEVAERALAAKSQEFRDWQARHGLGLQEITQNLPPDGVLLSYSMYRRPGTGPFAAPERHLVAYVTSPDAVVHVVPLGPVQRVDSLVALWSFEAAVGVGVSGRSDSESEIAYRRAGEALRQAVWDPLVPHLELARYIFVVPDGALHWIDFAALPQGECERAADGYLADADRRIHVLAAERDLVPPPPSPPGRGLLALGGADFDHVETFSQSTTGPAAPALPVPQQLPEGEIEVAMRHRGAAGPCEDLESLHFLPLPATAQEVADVAALWHDDEVVRILTGSAASDRAFKSLAPGKRILHLATHGFFLDGACAAVRPESRGIQLRRRPVESAERPAPAFVLRAGLALAGANRRDEPSDAAEDGILTADEIAALNLQGVEWAVLSACNTGLGEVQIGEGVLGLRRAFQVAGVGSVIMSLWPVADQPTRDWMRALYVAHLQRGLGTADAVHQAHRTTLAARRARGASTHPFYWAGFVSTGNWR